MPTAHASARLAAPTPAHLRATPGASEQAGGRWQQHDGRPSPDAAAGAWRGGVGMTPYHAAAHPGGAASTPERSPATLVPRAHSSSPPGRSEEGGREAASELPQLHAAVAPRWLPLRFAHQPMETHYLATLLHLPWSLVVQQLLVFVILPLVLMLATYLALDAVAFGLGFAALVQLLAILFSTLRLRVGQTFSLAVLLLANTLFMIFITRDALYTYDVRRDATQQPASGGGVHYLIVTALLPLWMLLAGRTHVTCVLVSNAVWLVALIVMCTTASPASREQAPQVLTSSALASLAVVLLAYRMEWAQRTSWAAGKLAAHALAASHVPPTPKRTGSVTPGNTAVVAPLNDGAPPATAAVESVSSRTCFATFTDLWEVPALMALIESMSGQPATNLVVGASRAGWKPAAHSAIRGLDADLDASHVASMDELLESPLQRALRVIKELRAEAVPGSVADTALAKLATLLTSSRDLNAVDYGRILNSTNVQPGTHASPAPSTDLLAHGMLERGSGHSSSLTSHSMASALQPHGSMRSLWSRITNRGRTAAGAGTSGSGLAASLSPRDDVTSFGQPLSARSYASPAGDGSGVAMYHAASDGGHAPGSSVLLSRTDSGMLSAPGSTQLTFQHASANGVLSSGNMAMLAEVAAAVGVGSAGLPVPTTDTQLSGGMTYPDASFTRWIAQEVSVPGVHMERARPLSEALPELETLTSSMRTGGGGVPPRSSARTRPSPSDSTLQGALPTHCASLRDVRSGARSVHNMSSSTMGRSPSPQGGGSVATIGSRGHADQRVGGGSALPGQGRAGGMRSMYDVMHQQPVTFHRSSSGGSGGGPSSTIIYALADIEQAQHHAQHQFSAATNSNTLSTASHVPGTGSRASNRADTASAQAEVAAAAATNVCASSHSSFDASAPASTSDSDTLVLKPDTPLRIRVSGAPSARGGGGRSTPHLAASGSPMLTARGIGGKPTPHLTASGSPLLTARGMNRLDVVQPFQLGGEASPALHGAAMGSAYLTARPSGAPDAADTGERFISPPPTSATYRLSLTSPPLHTAASRAQMRPPIPVRLHASSSSAAGSVAAEVSATTNGVRGSQASVHGAQGVTPRSETNIAPLDDELAGDDDLPIGPLPLSAYTGTVGTQYGDEAASVASLQASGAVVTLPSSNSLFSDSVAQSCGTTTQRGGDESSVQPTARSGTSVTLPDAAASSARTAHVQPTSSSSSLRPLSRTASTPALPKNAGDGRVDKKYSSTKSMRSVFSFLTRSATPAPPPPPAAATTSMQRVSDGDVSSVDDIPASALQRYGMSGSVESYAQLLRSVADSNVGAVATSQPGSSPTPLLERSVEAGGGGAALASNSMRAIGVSADGSGSLQEVPPPLAPHLSTCVPSPTTTPDVVVSVPTMDLQVSSSSPPPSSGGTPPAPSAVATFAAPPATAVTAASRASSGESSGSATGGGSFVNPNAVAFHMRSADSVAAVSTVAHFRAASAAAAATPVLTNPVIAAQQLQARSPQLRGAQRAQRFSEGSSPVLQGLSILSLPAGAAASGTTPAAVLLAPPSVEQHNVSPPLHDNSAPVAATLPGEAIQRPTPPVSEHRTQHGSSSFSPPQAHGPRRSMDSSSTLDIGAISPALNSPLPRAVQEPFSVVSSPALGRVRELGLHGVPLPLQLGQASPSLQSSVPSLPHRNMRRHSIDLGAGAASPTPSMLAHVSAASRATGGHLLSTGGRPAGTRAADMSSALAAPGTARGRLNVAAAMHEERERELVERLRTVTRWEFDIFEFERHTDGRPLAYLTHELFVRFDLFDMCALPTHVFIAFINCVERNYCYHPSVRNPYHTNVHAADVVQALGHFLVVPRLSNILDCWNAFAILLAGALHDFRHPGLSNAYLMKTGDPIAIRYNDESVLENFHAAEGFLVMCQPKYNVLAHLDAARRTSMRQQMIKIILATDLSQGGRYVSAFTTRASVADMGQDDADRLLLMQMMMKCSDVSHAAREWHVHEQWSWLVTEEFYLQGDAEAAAGLTVSPLCSRAAHNLPSSQLGFISFVVRGSFTALSDFCGVHTWLAQLDANAAQWAELRDAGALNTCTLATYVAGLPITHPALLAFTLNNLQQQERASAWAGRRGDGVDGMTPTPFYADGTATASAVSTASEVGALLASTARRSGSPGDAGAAASGARAAALGAGGGRGGDDRPVSSRPHADVRADAASVAASAGVHQSGNNTSTSGAGGGGGGDERDNPSAAPMFSPLHGVTPGYQRPHLHTIASTEDTDTCTPTEDTDARSPVESSASGSSHDVVDSAAADAAAQSEARPLLPAAHADYVSAPSVDSSLFNKSTARDVHVHVSLALAPAQSEGDTTSSRVIDAVPPASATSLADATVILVQPPPQP